jgi:L-amino acid N-acyltransferase YncA
MILQVIHPHKHIPWFHVAWQWREEYPRRVRRWDMVTSFDQWLEMMQGRVSVGVFAPTLTALVTLEPTGDDVYEVHVDCRRGVNHEALLTALLSIRRTVFEEWGAREVFVGVISRNGGIIRVARACGFTPDGTTEQAGPLKFIRLRMTDVQYQNEQCNRINQQHVYASTGSDISGHRSAPLTTVSG